VAAAILHRLTADDPHRPRLVWYGGGDAAGRTELSTASLTNWAAKTAGFLTDELGAGSGDTVLWRVRRSWQGLPLLLGCWWAGLAVTDDESAAGDAVAAFVDEGEESDANEVVVASTHPFGLAGADLPALYRHVADAVLPQADRFAPSARTADPGSPMIVTAAATLTAEEVLGRISQAAGALGPGTVLLSATVPDLPDGVCGGALAAWAAGGVLVQLGPDADLGRAAALAAAEHVTATLGVDVAGAARVG
jgi:uncharacterized protein (TIGR03089 family)